MKDRAGDLFMEDNVYEFSFEELQSFQNYKALCRMLNVEKKGVSDRSRICIDVFSM